MEEVLNSSHCRFSGGLPPFSNSRNNTICSPWYFAWGNKQSAGQIIVFKTSLCFTHREYHKGAIVRMHVVIDSRFTALFDHMFILRF